MMILYFNETVDQLVHCYGRVQSRESGHVLRRALEFEVEGQWKKRRPKRKWMRLDEEESMRVGLIRKDALHQSTLSC